MGTTIVLWIAGIFILRMAYSYKGTDTPFIATDSSDFLPQSENKHSAFDRNEQYGIGATSTLWDDDSDISSNSICSSDSLFSINPANGLPMMGCLDIEGNVYGTASHSLWDDFSSMSSGLDDSIGSSTFDSFNSSSFDD